VGTWARERATTSRPSDGVAHVKTGTEMISDAKRRIQQVTPEAALQEQSSAVFVDCREPNEFNLGHIPGAVFIPRGQLEQQIEARVPRDRRIVIYCASGNRSALGADTLQQMGYTNVASLAGGFRGWVEAGGEVDG
jgi:rhodanese-related sulfurtransferase